MLTSLGVHFNFLTVSLTIPRLLTREKFCDRIWNAVLEDKYTKLSLNDVLWIKYDVDISQQYKYTDAAGTWQQIITAADTTGAHDKPILLAVFSKLFSPLYCPHFYIIFLKIVKYLTKICNISYSLKYSPSPTMYFCIVEPFNYLHLRQICKYIQIRTLIIIYSIL